MSSLDAIVVEVSDKDFKARVFGDEDTSVGGHRTNVKVDLKASQELLEFAGIKEGKKQKAWGGGYGEYQHNRFLYLKQLAKGELVKVMKPEKSDDLAIVLPDGWTPSSTPVPSSPAPNSTAPSSAPAPVPAVQGEFQSLSPIQLLQGLLKLKECKWLWGQAMEAIKDVAPDISPDQTAASATTLFIEITPWKIRQDGGALSLPKGMREPMTPKSLYKMMQSEVANSGSLERSPQMQTAAVAVLSKLFTEKERHRFTKRMFGVESTKELSGGQLSAVITWTGADIKTGWKPTLTAVVEAGLMKEVL